MADAAEKLRQLRERQYEFAAHLRDPDRNPAPDDVEDRRMGIYRELFFNNVSKFLAGHFPITKDILGEAGWRSLVRDFYRDHQSQSPLFPDLPREFLAYLKDEREAGPDDPPFLYEFAHYEWVEAGIMLAPDGPPLSVATDGDLLQHRPVLAEPAWLLGYHFAVNEIDAEHQPTQPEAQPLHYVVYRNAADEVKFVKLNIVSARLFELLQAGKLTGRDALLQIAAELGHAEPEAIVNSGLGILEQWRRNGILRGTR